MNDNQTLERVIYKLLDLTKRNSIVWMRMPNYFESNRNEPLRSHVIKSHQYFYSTLNDKSIEEYKSYCTPINNGIVSFFAYTQKGQNQYILAMQSDVTSSVIELNTVNQFQDSLSSLSSLINSKKDGVSDLIEHILNMD